MTQKQKAEVYLNAEKIAKAKNSFFKYKKISGTRMAENMIKRSEQINAMSLKMKEIEQTVE